MLDKKKTLLGLVCFVGLIIFCWGGVIFIVVILLGTLYVGMAFFYTYLKKVRSYTN